jgi:hypothetical protein
LSIDVRLYKVLKSRLSSILKIISKYGIQCNVSPEELLIYLESSTYENDIVRLDNIWNNELLLLHEVAEICFLKRIGYIVSRNIIIEAYPDTYHAHLEALDIELAEAERQGKQDWIIKRCKDLESYLNDPYLPSNLETFVHKLINKYCNINAKIEYKE